MSPVELGHILSHLTTRANPDLLVGFDTSDDAGVYRVRENLALVQTVDLITPVCDDPYRFGQVAAANALSDVYAMGGRPLTVLNVCCFPGSGVPDGVFLKILQGGNDKSVEAGATLVGGHTVRDSELKYGLSVTGTIDPGRILRNTGARPGDLLVLTKPIGTGVLIAGAKKGIVAEEEFEVVLDQMTRLNDTASRLALSHDATACTDITGFGLACHTLEIARASNVGIRLTFAAIPRYERCLELIEKGITTGVTESNRAMSAADLSFTAGLSRTQETLFFDPQTSGGLLICVPADKCPSLVSSLHAEGIPSAAVIGEVLDAGRVKLEVAV